MSDGSLSYAPTQIAQSYNMIEGAHLFPLDSIGAGEHSGLK